MFRPAARCSTFFCWSSFFYALWSTSSVLMTSTNQHQRLATYYVVGTSITCALCYFLARAFGLYGAAASLLISETRHESVCRPGIACASPRTPFRPSSPACCTTRSRCAPRPCLPASDGQARGWRAESFDAAVVYNICYNSAKGFAMATAVEDHHHRQLCRHHLAQRSSGKAPRRKRAISSISRRRPDGVELTPYDQDFAEEMEAAKRVMRKNRDVLRRLAE